MPPSRRTHGMFGTRVYGVWNAMRQRCTNENQKSFPGYGGRGITVCTRWHKFENFLADMGEPPRGHSIERTDNDGNYEPSNCQWVPREKQAQNRRDTIYVEVAGGRLCLAEAARRSGISPSTLLHRYDRGWAADRLLAAPR